MLIWMLNHDDEEPTFWRADEEPTPKDMADLVVSLGGGRWGYVEEDGALADLLAGDEGDDE